MRGQSACCPGSPVRAAYVALMCEGPAGPPSRVPQHAHCCDLLSLCCCARACAAGAAGRNSLSCLTSPDLPHPCTPQVLEEVAILKQLHHPGLTSYNFIVDEGSRISVVMDRAGEGLREHRTLTHAGDYSEAVVRHMAYQLVTALVYLHSKVRAALGRCLFGRACRGWRAVARRSTAAQGLRTDSHACSFRGWFHTRALHQRSNTGHALPFSPP